MRVKYEFVKLFDRTFGRGGGWPGQGLHFARGLKVRQTALLKCDKMRVKCEFDKVPFVALNNPVLQALHTGTAYRLAQRLPLADQIGIIPSAHYTP
eukprot:1156876-Pelagomonas_calceolata.AAC.23